VGALRLWRRETNKSSRIGIGVDMLDLTHYHYKRQIDYLIHCVKGDEEPSPSGEDGRAAVEGVLALYQSWFTGRRVDLPLEKTPPLEEIFAKLRGSARAPRR